MTTTDGEQGHTQIKSIIKCLYLYTVFACLFIYFWRLTDTKVILIW